MKTLAIAATLAMLTNPSFAQTNKMADLADQLRNGLSGEHVTVRQEGAVTLTSGADEMFASGGWELNPDVPVLAKIIPILARLQHTEIVVDGYTDDTPITTLATSGIATNLDLSCKRAANVVGHLVTHGVNANLLSVQCFGSTHPVAPNDSAENKAKNRRVAITLIGTGE